MKSTWECEQSIFEVVKSGTIVVLPYIWSHTDQGVTPAKDIQVTIDADMNIGQALELAEEKALEYVQSHGANNIRHYFIEGVTRSGNKISFGLGT